MNLIEKIKNLNHKNGKYWLLLSLLWYILDQFTKSLAFNHLKQIGSVEIFGDLVRLTYAENTGMAFSISIFPSWILLVIAISTSVGLIVYLSRINSGWMMNLAFSLIIAGALGNATDRMLHGYVIDFVDVDFPDWIMHRWPIFNLADSGITISMFLLIFSSIFSKDLQQVEHTSSQQ